MGRARHNPFKGVMDTFSEMNRMREQLYTGNYEAASREEQPRTHATAWVPTTDIFADGDDLIIRCELAGVGREDVEITLSGGALVISGERKSEMDVEQTHFLVRERFYGHFRRSINLPDDVDDDDISATFHDGMLEVTVKGGADAAKPRRIQITDN
ncbi:MAG: Hsp20/alpha crystallin family protein [Rubrobacteraceae bacterium]